MIYRVQHNKENPYFMLNRAGVNDERLSFKAVGILTYLLSKPDNWVILEADIVKRHTDGDSAIRTGLKELRDFGYLEKVPVRDEITKRIARWETHVYETPQQTKSHNVENQQSGNSTLLKKDDIVISDSLESIDGTEFAPPIEEKAEQPEQPSNRPTAPQGKSQKPSTPAIPWQRQPSKKESNFLHLNARCPAAQRRPIVDALIAVHGLQAIIDSDSPDADRELNKMHELACTIHEMKMGVKDIERFAKLWAEKDFRGQKKQRPQNGQFLTFISQQLADTSGFPAEDPGEKAAYTITDSWDA